MYFKGVLIRPLHYYNNGQLKFEGEYKNDKRWNGKSYDKKGNFAYEIKNGIKRKYKIKDNDFI